MYGKANYLRQLACRMSMGDIPIGSNIVAYVRSTGQRSTDSAEITSKFHTSLATALAATTSGAYDVVVVLPGHSEAVGTTLMDNLLPGTYVIGVGNPDASDAPKFTWAVNSSNWLVDVANVTFANLRMYADADGISSAITVKAAGVSFVNCRFDIGNASDKDMTIAITSGATAAADKLALVDCKFLATAGAAVALSTAVAASELMITGCTFRCASAAADAGIVVIGTAAQTNILIANNVFEATYAASEAALQFSNHAHTGLVCDNRFGVQVDASADQTKLGIVTGGTNNLVRFCENYGSDDGNGAAGQVSGLICPAVTS